MNFKKVFLLAFALLILATGAFAYTVNWAGFYSTGGAECAKVGRDCLSNCSARTASGSATCSDSVAGSPTIWSGLYSSGDHACTKIGRNCIRAYRAQGEALACNNRSYAIGTALCSLNAEGSPTSWSGIFSSGDHACTKIGRCCLKAFTSQGLSILCNNRSYAIGNALCSLASSGSPTSWSGIFSSGDHACTKIGRCCIEAFTSQGMPILCNNRSYAIGNAVCSSSVVGSPVSWSGHFSSGNAECASTGKACWKVFNSQALPRICSYASDSMGDALCSNTQTCPAPPVIDTSDPCVVCQCTSGVCCDGCNFRSAGTVCDTQNQNVCAGGACGNDWVSQRKTRTCTGGNANCTGGWSGWVTQSTIQNCSAEQKCSASVPHCVNDPSCIPCTDDCSAGDPDVCSPGFPSTSVIQCGYFDADPCLDLATVPCGFGLLCFGGSCLGCTPGAWVDAGCEQGGCAAGQMYQTRTNAGFCPFEPTEQCAVAPSKCQCSLGETGCVPAAGGEGTDSWACQAVGLELHKVATDCGVAEQGTWGDNYCKSGDVYRKRTDTARGCQVPSGSCYETTTDVEELVEDCSGSNLCGTIQCVLGSPNSAYCGLIPDPAYGLLSYWKFEEGVGGTATDSSGNSHDATINGATLDQVGQVGKAFSFSGSAENSVTVTSSDWAFTDEDFSITGWAN